jgi:hypothetical protein
LKWHVVPATTKHNKKSKRKSHGGTASSYKVAYPCYICPNQAEATAGLDEVDQKNIQRKTVGKETTTTIRYIGHRVSYRDQLCQVALTQLLPHNVLFPTPTTSQHEVDRNDNQHDVDTNNNNHHDNSNGSANVSSTPSCDLDNAAPNQNDQVENQWNSELMALYMKSLRSAQKAFKTEDGALRLKVEEHLLQNIAAYVLEREQEQLQLSAEIAKQNEVDAAIDDEGTDLWKLSQMEATTTTRNPASVARKSITTVTTLRTGDIVEYSYVQAF